MRRPRSAPPCVGGRAPRGQGNTGHTCVDDLAADTFSSDEEVEDFLAFTRAEHRRDLA
jgi:hypothetical protein